jgi:cytochrome c biogenesis protein CcmG, thiol:disulfide interchange protein DsbE
VLVGIAIAVVAMVAAVTVVVISDNQPASTPTSAKGVATVGEAAPDFALKTLDGKTVRLSDYAGKPVVVNFWASYCHPCRQEFPMFRQALEQHHNDFVLLGVDYRDIASDARKFAKDKRATWPILEDPGDQVALAYGVRAVPQTFFIGRDGKISQRYYAQVPDDLFEQELAKISKPAAVTTTTTTPPR